MLLETIRSPADLRDLDPQELEELAGEIRDFIVAAVAENSGHLGSNLGAVELTLALHRVFDSPRDAILWDTGHQAYVHKIVTGRAGGLRAAAPGRRAVRLPVPRGVGARLRREQPRLDDPLLRVRSRRRPRQRGRPEPAAHRRRHRRRLADRRHGLRGAEQPRPQRPQRDHRPQRQRPLVRADGVEAVQQPHVDPPEPRLHAAPAADGDVPARPAARRLAGREGPRGLQGRGPGVLPAAGVLRDPRCALRRSGRRARHPRARGGDAQRHRVRRPDRHPRPHPEGPRATRRPRTTTRSTCTTHRCSIWRSVHRRRCRPATRRPSPRR